MVVVLQLLMDARLATNRLGRADEDVEDDDVALPAASSRGSRSTSRLALALLPPVTVTGAQFM